MSIGDNIRTRREALGMGITLIAALIVVCHHFVLGNYNQNRFNHKLAQWRYV